MNAELGALRMLAQAIADRLEEENDRRYAAGHGRHDADPADLVALMRCKQDWDDALAVVRALRKHLPIEQKARKQPTGQFCPRFNTIWGELVQAHHRIREDLSRSLDDLAEVLEANEDWNDFVALTELEPGDWHLCPGTAYWGDQPTIRVHAGFATRFPEEANSMDDDEQEAYSDGKEST